MTATLRQAAVAGRFYPGNPEALKHQVRDFCAAVAESKRIHALGCIVPHAGYMYSGHVAGAVFGRIEIPQRVVILCPNHTGIGPCLSVMSAGEWQTPLGRVRIDEELGSCLKMHCPHLEEDREAHRAEHAVEVQLPFLQVQRNGLTFVPIVVGTSRYPLLAELGAALAQSISEQREPVLLIASSDMNHYEDDAMTRRKDARAIERVLALDPRGLYEAVTREDISMCGYGPAVAMLTAAKQMDAKSAELIKYATSGDVSGEREQVVGYAGIAVS